MDEGEKDFGFVSMVEKIYICLKILGGEPKAPYPLSTDAYGFNCSEDLIWLSNYTMATEFKLYYYKIQNCQNRLNSKNTYVVNIMQNRNSTYKLQFNFKAKTYKLSR